MPLRLLLLIILCLPAAARAQQTVSGTVTSADDGQPLPFVTVAVKGTVQAVSTDIQGAFSIQALPSDTLSFSFVGYATALLAVGDRTMLDVRMERSAKELSEVVVTALGVKRQKRELGYSTEQLDGGELRQSNSPNLVNAMTGKAAGVQITNPDGVDGGTTRMTIRGNNNISSNNQPLIVVDGIPIDNDPGMTDIGRGRDWGSAINNINMDDVESINILKGGAASALYGARGANGVVLITMKKGKPQKGLGVSYTMSYKVTHPYRYRDVQNVYGGGAPSLATTVPQLAFDTSGLAILPTLVTDPEFGYPGSSVSWGPKLEGQPITWWDHSLRTWSPQPDNLKIPFQDGHQATYNIAAEGGNEKGSLRMSVTRTDNTPIVYNSNYNQTTVATNATLKITDKVSLGTSVSYMNYHRLNSPMLGEDPQSFSKGLLYSWPRSYQGEDFYSYALPDGTRNEQEGYPYLYVSPYLWWNYFNNNTTLDRSKLIGSLSLNYQVTSWLSLMGRTGIDYTDDAFREKHKPADYIGLLDGYYGETTATDRSLNGEFLLTAEKKDFLRKGLRVSFNLGGSSWDRDMHALSAHSGTWYFPNWYNLGNYTATTYKDSAGLTVIDRKGDDPQDLVAGNTYYRKRIHSLYSFLNLSFSDVLFVELTGRNDWSSTLPPDASSYFYPGLSVSYVLSEGLKWKTKWLNFLKVRGGIAQTATDADPYLTEFYYPTLLFAGEQSSVYPDTIPTIGLKPQRVNSYEAGVNAGLWDDRITLDITYYYNYCFDQIIPNLPVPPSSGAGFVAINDGVLTNTGFEIILNATLWHTDKLTVKSGLNFSRNRNKVVSLGDNVDTYIQGEIWGENGPQIALHEGDDYGTITGWDYVYLNGQPVLNAEGTKYKITDTRIPVGNASPDFLAGWTTAIRYKNLTLTTLIDTKWGGDIYCGSWVIGQMSGQNPETLTERDGGGLPYTDASGLTSPTGVILPGVHEDGTPNTTVVPYYYKYIPNAGGWGHFLTTPGIIEDTWVKFREVTLTYALPEKVLKRLKIFRELSASLTARDLFYIYSTVPDHINPEGTLGAGNAQGLEWGSLPGVRSFAFGLQARF
jgi:iron complex outermembrane receptor protein